MQVAIRHRLGTGEVLGQSRNPTAFISYLAAMGLSRPRS
jgi:hypothetical protein